MAEKHKSFLNLSSRQKRRRLCVFPGRIAKNIHTESENNADQICFNNLAHFENDNAQYVNVGIEYDKLNDVRSQSQEGEEPRNFNDLEDTMEPEDAVDRENPEELEDPVALKKKILKNAFLDAGLKHSQGNIILHALREFPFSLIYLPKDTRTLLQTPKNVASRCIDQIAGGEYLHIGLKSTMIKKLESLPADKLPATVEIDFSTDGAKVNRGLHQFWPHQYRILNIGDKRPIIAGIYKGIKKPSNVFDFYEKFVAEIREIRQEGGIRIRDQLLPVNVRCFIADAPARAFGLNHYGHTSTCPCSKCKIEGYRSDGTMVFTSIENGARSDDNYHDANDEDHHKGRSPLAEVLGLVTNVPFKIMHLVYLGVTRKIFSAKLNGNFGHQKLNGRKINIIDSRMEQLSNYCPSEFNRRPRKISLYGHFKATEFRQVLLYTAPAVLQNVFDQNDYLHFMMLHSAIRLLNFEETPRVMYEFCRQVLRSFVTLCRQLYGEKFMSYNVHGLLHVVDDVEELFPAESFSAFCYENNMPTLRKLIRKPHLTLQQIYKRLGELNNISFAPLDNNIHIRPSLVHADGPLPENMPAGQVFRQFKKLEIGEFSLSIALRDNCCTLTDFKICLIENILEIEDEFVFLIREFRKIQAVYDVGVTSDIIGVYRCTDLSERLQAVNLSQIKSKVYRMPQWSSKEGEEEIAVENQWICVNLISQIIFPQN